MANDIGVSPCPQASRLTIGLHLILVSCRFPFRIQVNNSNGVKMPASHSNLHFVNLSKPNEGKDEETRRAVRTHVMQQYIQKKRLREKRRERQTPFERTPRLRCKCPTIQAVPQAFDTSSNWQTRDIGICPTCCGRRWSMTDTGSDHSSGSILADQQAVTRYSSQERWRMDHPATVLGAGRVDPFAVYPVEAQPYMHDLLDHCMYQSLTVLLASFHGLVFRRWWVKLSSSWLIS